MRVLCAVAVLAVLLVARPLLVPIAIAVLFTFVLAPAVRALGRRGVPEYVGSALVVASLLAGVALMAWMVAAPAAAWWSRAPATLNGLLEAAQRWRSEVWPIAPGAPAGASGGSSAEDTLGEQLATQGFSFTRIAVGEALGFTLSSSAVVILLFFMLASEHWLVARTLEAIPRRRTRALLLSGIRESQRDIGLFIWTMSLVNVALGIATGLALWAIGLPNPVLWGTVTALLTFVPYLGPLVVTLMLMLAGSVAFGVGWSMFGPPAAFLALHAVEANFLTPLIMGRQLSLPPVFVFLSVMVLGWLWGVAGAFLAVPLLLGLRALCRRVRRGRTVCRYLDGNGTAVPPLQRLLQAEPAGAGRVGAGRSQP
ncbi:AI-2E family transporter [Piscinibacter koreensis]|uniref:AI-2E family transporter n=1 Tax=Piscinibacter koreensis TaxID=2742824 RepID=A0A7Y6NLV5_9BURK|nr:AI-2E family transporter [Schlegelella koreensis]